MFEFLPRYKDVIYDISSESVFAKNDNGTLTKVGTVQVAGTEDATAGLLLFAGLARLALGGAVALVDSVVTSLPRSFARWGGSEAGVLSLSRGASLPVPKVTNKKLANIVRDLFKGVNSKNPIGTGSTADAVRSELATGVPTGGKFHSSKAQDYIRALDGWLRNNPEASHHYRLVAQSLRDDLASALAGK